MKATLKKISGYYHSKALQPLFHVGIFALLLMSSHYLYILWMRHGFYPFATQVDQLFIFASDILFNQSVWLLKNIFHLNHTTDGQTIWVTTNTGAWGYVDVSPHCTSLKQWMHWIFIMLLFPGPWKHKLWYIPLGIITIHFVNIIRIVGLSLTLIPWPQHFDFFHDYIFKTFFYFMIFVMWVVWVENILQRPRKKTLKNETID
jgi:exosortase/archaeosortase family protein